MITTDTDTLVTIEFESHDDLLDHLKKYPKDQWTNANSQDPAYSNFCEYEWDETLEHLHSGWKEGVAKINALTDSIKTKLDDTIEQYTVSHDVAGQFIDMGRFVDGTPECMGYVEMIPQPMETLDIVINIGARASVGSTDIYTRGAAITSLVDELQKSYFITVKFVSYCERNAEMSKDIQCIFNLNMINEYSRDLLAFYIAHTGMLRRIIFAIREMYFGEGKKGSVSRFIGNYGYSQDVPVDEGTLYFEKIERYSGWGNADTAATKVGKILKKYNKGDE